MWGVLRSEWTKFYSYPWSIFGLIGAALTPPIVLFFMSASSESDLATRDVLALCLRTLYLGQVGVVVAAAGFFGQEYSSSCMRTSFLAVPSRKKLILAKSIVLFISVFITGVVSALLSLVAGTLGFSSELTFDLTSKYWGDVTLALSSWIQIAFITSSISVLTKSLVAPIAIMISLILGLSQLLFSVSTLAKYLPDLATMTLFLATDTSVYLNELSGIIAQGVWVIVLWTAASWLILRCDAQ